MAARRKHQWLLLAVVLILAAFTGRYAIKVHSLHAFESDTRHQVPVYAAALQQTLQQASAQDALPTAKSGQAAIYPLSAGIAGLSAEDRAALEQAVAAQALGYRMVLPDYDEWMDTSDGSCYDFTVYLSYYTNHNLFNEIRISALIEGGSVPWKAQLYFRHTRHGWQLTRTHLL